ncbi:MAG: hypothetical protein R3D84_15325 [Paracoccaceae bacterium]
MSTRDTMELREEAIRAHYPAALTLLQGLDHTPRLARAAAIEQPPVRRSPANGAAARFSFHHAGACHPHHRPARRRAPDRTRVDATAEDGLPGPCGPPKACKPCAAPSPSRWPWAKPLANAHRIGRAEARQSRGAAAGYGAANSLLAAEA